MNAVHFSGANSRGGKSTSGDSKGKRIQHDQDPNEKIAAYYGQNKMECAKSEMNQLVFTVIATSRK